MNKIHVLVGFFLFISIDNMILSSDLSKDKVPSSIKVSGGTIYKYTDSICDFCPDLQDPNWIGTDWSVCRILVDPLTRKITKIETEVNEGGKVVKYNLPDENPIFRKMIENLIGPIIDQKID